MEIVAGEQGFALQQLTFSIQIFLIFFLIKTVKKSHSLMPGASNLVILMFWTCFYPFLACLKLQPIIL